MKKTYSFLIILLILAGCKESFLDTNNLTQKTSSNFPGTPDEAQQALNGVYSIQNTVGTGWGNILLYSEYMSDDRFGGGGQHDPNPQAASYFLVANSNILDPLWKGYYQGIYRANTLLESLKNVKGLSKADRSKIVGETSFLRGLFYFDLSRLFSTPEVIDGHQGTVPLVLSTIPADLPRATEDAMYGQIAADLKTAIDSLSSDPIGPGWNQANLGRVNKYAAEGMMARVFLFYTGYYKKTEITLPDGSKMSKANVLAYLEDVISKSGCSLVPDFRNQWPYTFDTTTYKYAKDNHLKWVGEPTNPENIFVVTFTGFSSNVWGEKSNYTNGFFNCGQRDPTARLPIAHGWGFGPVNPRLYQEWPVANDLRKQGSIYSVDDPSEGIDYIKAADKQWNETYYLEKKYVPVNVKDKTGSIVNWCHILYPGIDINIQLESVQNMVLLRLADVYLMAAELGSPNAQTYFDKVRGRAVPGYVAGSVAPTLDNIKIERHCELAFEGIRYWDLLRWYGPDAGNIIKANKTGAVIYNAGEKTTIDQDRTPSLFSNIPARVKNTGGFNMIPQNQMDLSKSLKQNPGWSNAGEYMYQF
jgi:hypothetical protein